MPITLSAEETEIRRIKVQSQPTANSWRDPISKKKPSQERRAGGVVQVVEHLPRKLEALSSNTSAAKKKKKIF
jgi:hypothetical protein